jgi:hypothetical protein
MVDLAWHFRQDSSRDPYCGGLGGNVGDDERICSDVRMITNLYRPENLRSGSDVHVAANHRNPRPAASNRYLLKDQAIHPDPGVRVDYDAVRMRDKQTPSDVRIQLDSGPSDQGPEPVRQNKPFAHAKSDNAPLAAPILITPDCQEEFAARIPEPLGSLTAPIGNLGADGFYSPDFFFHIHGQRDPSWNVRVEVITTTTLKRQQLLPRNAGRKPATAIHS